MLAKSSHKRFSKIIGKSSSGKYGEKEKQFISELLFLEVRMKGLEPPRLTAPDPKSGAAAITPHPQLLGLQRYVFFQNNVFLLNKSNLS